MRNKRTFLIVVLLICMLLVSFGCEETTEPANALQIKQLDKWLRENIEQQELYQFTCTVTFRPSEEDEASEDYVQTIKNERYTITVTVDKTNQAAKFELKKIARWLPAQGGEEIKWNITQFSDQIYYLTIKNKKVTLYLPTDAGYDLMICKDAQLANQLSAILFPDDISIFEGTLSDTIYEVENADVVVKDYQNNLFYGPFRELSKEYEDIPLLSGIKLIYVFNPESDTELPQMRIIERNGSTELLKYAYPAFMSRPVSNTFTRNGADYQAILQLDFEDDMLDVQSFNVPKLKN